MCTGLSIKTKNGAFFGRNMDLEYNFNQSVITMPKGYKFIDKVNKVENVNQQAIIGMGTIIGGYVTYAEAMNENGLACAGLNFFNYAHFEKELKSNKTNIAPYDFIQWTLSNFKTTEEAKEGLKDLYMVDVPIAENVPVPTLHWMISDKEGKSIVVEQTIDGLKVFDNPVNVLTNNPTFDWHLKNLNQYLYLTPRHQESIEWGDLVLKSQGSGTGTLGMPGDFMSVSRFIRIAFLRNNLPPLENRQQEITHFFNMLDYVKMVKGGVITETGKIDLTLYTSCMDLDNGIYYYRTYDNHRINAIDLHKSSSTEVVVYPYLVENDINYQN